jgi:hypothetical protein
VSRYIQYSAYVTDRAGEPWRVTLRITAQGRYGDGFLPDPGHGNDTRRFEASNGVDLRSAHLPAYCTDELYVRGEDNENDNLSLHIPAAQWPRIKLAIDEYNAKYASAMPRHGTTAALRALEGA